jgi:hypothetical protein
MTSSALLPVFGCLSTGMPRPSSVTVSDVPSGRADSADVHAGALADGLEAFQNGDVFGCIRRRRHKN